MNDKSKKQAKKTADTYAQARANKPTGIRLSVDDLKRAAEKLGYTVKKNPHKS